MLCCVPASLTTSAHSPCASTASTSPDCARRWVRCWQPTPSSNQSVSRTCHALAHVGARVCAVHGLTPCAMRRAVVGVAAKAIEANYTELTARLRQPGALIANVLDPFSDVHASQASRDACASFAEAAESLGRNHSTPAAHGNVLSDDSGGAPHMSPPPCSSTWHTSLATTSTRVATRCTTK